MIPKAGAAAYLSLMAKCEFPVTETDFHSFRRWLKARDPDAVLTYEPAGDELWMLKVTTTKAYIARMSERRWRAPGS